MARKPKFDPEESALYQLMVYASADLRGDWHGWRLRGRYLISPEGERITPNRLRGILFAETLRHEAAKSKGKTKRNSAPMIVPFSRPVSEQFERDQPRTLDQY